MCVFMKMIYFSIFRTMFCDRRLEDLASFGGFFNFKVFFSLNSSVLCRMKVLIVLNNDLQGREGRGGGEVTANIRVANCRVFILTLLPSPSHR